VFLHPNAPWNVLCWQAGSLYVRDISMYEVYCNYIFPHFNTMNSATRVNHIKFISENVYLGYNKSQNYSQANKFIFQFRSLKCIGDGVDLRSIQSFYDHTQKIFVTFCDDSCFLPKELQDKDLQKCLKYFGLRTVPTTKEFLEYCHSVAKLDQISDVENASKILLETLFRDDIEYHNQGFSNRSFLQKVSKIPIAIVCFINNLNAIKPQKLGEFNIDSEDGSKSISITKLSGSSLVQYKESLWTCKPLIELPISLDAMHRCAEKIRALDITVTPSINDIVQNLHNLADSEFADFSRFHKQISPQTVYSSNELPGITMKMIKCLVKNIKKDSDYESLKLQLENLNFIPVKLQIDGYVLVKPIQVLFMDPSKLAPYYPFLHPLVKEVQPAFSLLSQIGIKMSLDFSYMKLVFKLAKEIYQDKKVNINVKHTAAKATVELTMLLRNAANTKQAQLQPL